jgi:hypothetical protein
MRSQSTLKNSALTLALTVVASTLAACSPALHFTEVEKPNIEVFETSSKFSSYSVKPLDIVWVIDNSGSMGEEAAHVRTNLAAFLGVVQTGTALRMALISAKGNSGTNVSIPAGAELNPNFLHIEKTVGSTDPVQIAASALCPSQPSATSKCKDSKITSYTDVRSKLLNFLRPDSKKVFVFVTDDESNLPAATFISVFKEAFPGETPTTFGFVGLGASSPCQARAGTVYKSLADLTGGAVFNICDASWTSRFATLAENVVKLASDEIKLPAAVLEAFSTGKILTVEVGGRLMHAAQYVIENGIIKFDPEAVAGIESAQVRITYSLPEPEPVQPK